jgi:hypothetical protein
MNYALIGIRVVLGVVLLWSGLAKVGQPYTFLSMVYDYEFFTYSDGLIVAACLPFLEITIGASLIAGTMMGGSLLLCTVTFLALTLVQLDVILSGREILCGCFTISKISGSDHHISWFTLLRTVIFLSLSVIGLRYYFMGRAHTKQIAGR